MRNSIYKSHKACLKTVMSMDMGDSPSKIIVCLVCLLLALSSMTCDRYTNVSEGRYLTNGFSQFTDSMPVILACNETSSLFTKRSRLRVEQWFRPSMPFTLYSDDIWVEHDGQLFKPIMRDIQGRKIDSVTISGLMPIAFDITIKKDQKKIFGDSVMVIETIDQQSRTDSIKIGFCIQKCEDDNAQYDSLYQNPQYREIGAFYSKQQKIEPFRFFWWLDLYPHYGVEGAETLDPMEAELLDSLFEAERGDFSFSQKRVLIMNPVHIGKEHYLNQYFQHQKNSKKNFNKGTLYIYNENQRQRQQGCDATIGY